MKPPIAYVNIRFLVHATENSKNVERAVCSLVPSCRETPFRKKELRGYYNNPIALFETRLKDAAAIKAFTEKLAAGLSDADKESILKESNLFAEKNDLYLRLDKQAAFKGEFKLRQADPIHIRIRFRKEGKSRTEVLQEMGIVQ